MPDVHYQHTAENKDDPYVGPVERIDIVGYKTSMTLINPEVDETTGQIVTREMWRGIGDASSSGIWDVTAGGYQFRDTAEADAILDGDIGDQLFQKLEPKGLIGLAYMEQGFRHTTNSTRPITKWENFEGLKIRVQPSALYIDMFNQLGANAVPMTINEVYTAMETRAIDGHENSLTAIDANKF